MVYLDVDRKSRSQVQEPPKVKEYGDRSSVYTQKIDEEAKSNPYFVMKSTNVNTNVNIIENELSLICQKGASYHKD